MISDYPNLQSGAENLGRSQNLQAEYVAFHSLIATKSRNVWNHMVVKTYNQADSKFVYVFIHL